jgi:acyl carrier protein
MPDAFRLMAQGAHTGKIVVAIDADAAPVRPRRAAVPRDWAAGTYLITGGSGGLGVEVARWMAGEGARRIVLMGRRGEDADLTSRLQPLRDAGVTVHVARGDVARLEDVRGVIGEIDRTMSPLAGIVHAAGILDDSTIAQLDEAKFQRVLSPKVTGAWSLHEATAGRALDFFVLFSSVTSFIGSAGQANYAAANAFLDSLAAFRRGLGLPAQSINWGPWGEIGLAAERSDRGARLAERGLGSLSPAVGIGALGEALRRNAVQAAVMAFDAQRWCEAIPAEWRLFAELRAEATQDAASAPKSAGLRDALTAAPSGRRRRTVLESSVQQMVAQVLKLAPSRIDLNKPLRTMGLDSLMGLELRNRLEAATGVSLPATLVWNYPTIVQLAPQLAARMEISLEDVAQAAEAATPDSRDAEDAAAMETLLSEIEGLSEEDARRVLAEEL